MAQTMFSAFCHELPKTLLLVPVLYDNENRFTANNDLGLHTTINAQKILLDINAKNFVYNHIENKDELEDNEKGRFIIEKDGNPIYVHMNGEKIIEFLGSDEYDVADKPGGEGCMHFCTVKSPQGEPALPAFTNLNDLKRIYGNTVHIGLATYDDLINEINNGSVLNGIVFNPGGISLFIAKDELVLVEKEMQEKPEIYTPNFNNTDKQRKGDPSKEFEGIYSSELSEKILRTHVNFEKNKKKWNIGIIASVIAAIVLAIALITSIFSPSPNIEETKTQELNGEDTREESILDEEVINNDNKKLLESIQKKYKEIPLTEKIDKIYVTYGHDKEPKIPSIHMPGEENASVFITHKESKANTSAWVGIDTKKEALVYFDFAKKLGATRVICLVESESGMKGFTCDINDVINGYMNNDWSFDEAEKLFNEQEQNN